METQVNLKAFVRFPVPSPPLQWKFAIKSLYWSWDVWLYQLLLLYAPSIVQVSCLFIWELCLHEVTYRRWGRLTWISWSRCSYLGVWRGERAADQQRLIAEGCLSRRSDLIPFKDAQWEAWKGIFQQQHVHCWDAEMQQGSEGEGWTDTLLSSYSQRMAVPGTRVDCWMCRGLLPSLPRGVGCASVIEGSVCVSL